MRGAICGSAMREVSRQSEGVRWCFNHRARAEFVRIVTATVEPSYYEPNVRIECSVCGQIDGDVGFGGCREWC